MTDLTFRVDESGFWFSSITRPTESAQLSREHHKVPEEIVRQQALDRLYAEELAELRGNDFLVQHQTVADLPEDEAKSLGLPDAFPFDVEISALGSLTDPSLRYSCRFVDAQLQPLTSALRQGSLLTITEQQRYLLSGDIYHLVEAIEEFNNRPQDQKGHKNNLLTFANIKGLARKAGAALDTYLRSEQVVAPANLKVLLKRGPEGLLEIEPTLSFVGESCTSDHDPASDSFVKVFDKLPVERDIYSIPEGPRIVFDDKQKQALKQFKRYRKVSGTDKEALLKSPQSFFDPEVVDLDSFSERVHDIGEYRPHVFPFLRPQKESWLPPEGGIIIDGEMISILPEERQELVDALREAAKSGHAKVDWKDRAIPATTEVIQAIQTLTNFNVGSLSGENAGSVLEKASDQRKILVIKDNFEDTAYQPNQNRRSGVPGTPKSLKSNVTLLRHQKEGLEWLQLLWMNGANGALLADDMGLGKTLQALTFMAWCRELMDAGSVASKPMLIVTPLTLLENWKTEYEHFLRPVFGPLLVLHGRNLQELKNQSVRADLGIVRREIDIRQKSDLERVVQSGRGLLLRHSEIARNGAVLTTYETIRDYQFSLGLIDWCVMVLDEAQKVKTPSTLVTLAAKAMKYDFGLAMTGTPVENTWVDLWCIIDFVQPGHLGSLKDFVAQFQRPLENPKTDRQQLGQALKQRVGSVLKRRMKEDHLEGLPKKTVNIYKVQMPKEQFERYLGVVRAARNKLPPPGKLKDGQTRKQHIFGTIAALRDISLSPHLPFHDDVSFAQIPAEAVVNSSARLIKTVQLLDDIRRRNEKVIIFLTSRKMQLVMQRIVIEKYGITPYIVNGEVTGGRRKELVDRFQGRQGFNIIIMSTEAAGIGLNVTAANHVIHLSRAWNPAKEDQASDRVYRIGQTRDVTLHFPLAWHPVIGEGGSFDLKIHRLLDEKRGLSRSVLLPGFMDEQEWESFGNEIFGSVQDAPQDTAKLTVERLDQMSPQVFVSAVVAIYQKKDCEVELLARSQRKGVDLKVLDASSHRGLLAKCCHCSPRTVLNQQTIEEALNGRDSFMRRTGQDCDVVVVSNGSFSDSAKKLGGRNGVSLVSRDQLAIMLEESDLNVSELSTSLSVRPGEGFDD